MKRIVGMTIVVALLLAPGLAGARARCDSKLAVWSGVGHDAAGSVTYGGVPAATCIHGTTSSVDSRVIHGDTITVAFDSLYIKGRPFVMATLTGLGFHREYAPLGFDDRGTVTTNDDLYLSQNLTLPHGAQANGCLTVVLKLTEKRGRRTVTTYSDSTTYRTAGVTC